jgi:hypothetical protein
MSELSHHETAKLILQRIQEQPDWYGDVSVMETLTRAHVHATLALVEAVSAGVGE